VYGINNSAGAGGIGVAGLSLNSTGVRGQSNGTSTAGVMGLSANANGVGVIGLGNNMTTYYNNLTGGAGVLGQGQTLA
jgi:hypothetical protein